MSNGDELIKSIHEHNRALINKQYSMFGGNNLIKGNGDRREAQIGEVREWSGQKMKKTSDGWVPVTGDRKGAPKKVDDKKSAKQDDSSNKQSKQDDKPSSKVDEKEKQQLSQVKKLVEEGNLEQAAEIANKLSETAQRVIPSKTWAEMSQAQQADKDQEGGNDKLIEQTQTNRFKKFVNNHKEVFDTGEHTHPERSKLSKLIRGKTKGIVKGFKHELHHMKESGGAIKKLISGKKPSTGELKALKKVGITLGLTIGSMVATGGTSIFAHGVGSFFSHLGIHFVEHVAIEVGALGMIFAKAIHDKFNDDDIEAQFDVESPLTDDELAKFVDLFAEFCEHGDWSQMIDGSTEEKENEQ